eukprot:10417940-Ditylum_brightwellii.AAC.1
MEAEPKSSDVEHHPDDANANRNKKRQDNTGKQEGGDELKEDEKLTAAILASYDYFMNVSLEVRPDIKPFKWNPVS